MSSLILCSWRVFDHHLDFFKHLSLYISEIKHVFLSYIFKNKTMINSNRKDKKKKKNNSDKFKKDPCAFIFKTHHNCKLCQEAQVPAARCPESSKTCCFLKATVHL